ncbi:MAG: M23 family metallopeptidase [candidate division Zixibacteria bacterium]|jgi:murein DD-endopeptidase MepM/ murein hydrolase activator NlpD|nr:M23 family metallopeptidase [candidate division Zixibacteria bacterium]
MNKFINILIIPEGKEPSYNFRLSVKTLKILGGVVCIWVLLMITGTIFLGKLLDRSRQVEILAEKNQKLMEQNARVIEIEKEYKKNRELMARIAGLAGIDLESVGPNQESNYYIGAADTQRGNVTGIPGDGASLPERQLDSLRTPQGRPLYGWITRNFNPGENYGKDKHDGVDIAVKEGTPVTATATGEVSFAGWDEDFGNMVIIDHGNGYKTIYGHNQKLLVEVGDKVFKGKVVALSGNSGKSSAPHLHYGITKDGEPIDPAPYLE